MVCGFIPARIENGAFLLEILPSNRNTGVYASCILPVMLPPPRVASVLGTSAVVGLVVMRCWPILRSDTCILYSRLHVHVSCEIRYCVTDSSVSCHCVDRKLCPMFKHPF